MILSSREEWKQAAEITTKLGFQALGNALLPGTPVVGQLAGAAASEVLADHRGTIPNVVPVKLRGHDLAESSGALVTEALARTTSEIEAAGGYGEIRLPRNFSMHELEDHECHQLAPPDLAVFQAGLDALQELRTAYGRPMTLTSAWRSLHHSAETKKGPDAIHRHYHCAFDVACHTGAQDRLLSAVYEQGGWTGKGISARGPLHGRFLHLDRLAYAPGFWGY